MQTPYKLFTDGNSFPRAKRSGFGGYIETPSGEVVLDFTEQVRENQYFHSFEILGILRGLQLALDYGIKDIVSFCDDKVTSQRLREIFVENTFAVSEAQKPELYEKVMEVAEQFNSVSFQYIPRQFNKKADHLSRMYAKSMEESWLSQYKKALVNSANNLEHDIKPKRKAFFSHPSLLQLIHKGNPFMVAQQRSKMVRKVLRAEDKKDFNYIFVEYFENEEDNSVELDVRLFNDKKEMLFNWPSKQIFPNEISEIDRVNFFHNCLNDSIIEISDKFPALSKLWINSNDDHIMAYTEQCEKIPPKTWDSFRSLYHSLDNFEKVVFHHLPFDVELTFCPVKEEQEELSDDQKWATMLEEYYQIDNTRERRKKLGQLICHTLKTMKKNGTELTEDMVNDVIHKIEVSVNNQPSIKPKKSF